MTVYKCLKSNKKPYKILKKVILLNKAYLILYQICNMKNEKRERILKNEWKWMKMNENEWR